MKIICGYGAKLLIESKISLEDQRNHMLCQIKARVMLNKLFCAGLTCKSRVRFDGGELEGHFMLVSVDDQVLLQLEALQHTDRVRKI